MRQNSNAITVLVLSSGDGTGVNFVRSLKRAGGYRIVGIDSTFDDYVNSEADDRILVQPATEARLLEIINQTADRYEADLVYAADTDSLLALLSRERGSMRARTFLPDYSDHMRAEDKWLTYQSLASIGLPVPDTALIQTHEDLKRMLALHEHVWLRRVCGSGGNGSLATDSEELAHAWITSKDGWGEFTAAECLSERTATFSGVWYEGQLIASQLRERTSWKYAYLSASGVTGITSGQKTVWDEELHDLAVQSVSCVLDRPHGAVGVDFTYGHDGRPYVTEVQPARFYSSMEFLAAVGINLPDIYCRLALRLPLSDTGIFINPVREAIYWYKAVDKMPTLLTQEQVDDVSALH